MPLTLAWHCSKLEKPQLSVPPRPEYSAHHAALAGVCVSTAGIITSAATITLALKRIASLLMLMENNLISTRQARYWPMVQRLKEARLAVQVRAIKGVVENQKSESACRYPHS
jgi:hypothetical protein